MNTLAIDIETYSSVDLNKAGVYKYVESPDFEILLLAYSLNGGERQVVDMVNIVEDRYSELVGLLTSVNTLTAWNAAFERVCINKYFGLNIPPEQWSCTMVRAANVGLPLSLDAAAKVLKLEQGKDAAGKGLINYFCKPCKPTKSNGGRTRNLPHHDPEKWEAFKAYCLQDVAVEQAIGKKVDFFQQPKEEQQLWCLDQRINDNGILLDPAFIDQAIRINAEYNERLSVEAVKLTGLDNPNSAAQLKDWLSKEMDSEVTSLKKGDLPALLDGTDDDTVKRVLGIRAEMSKTSVKKYASMVKAICTDNRVRGLLQFYGANRTGRWAGRLVQVQNLPQNHLEDLDAARQLVSEGDGDWLEMLFGNVPDTLSQLIRTAFVAPDGHRFIVADFSAIEARVIAWLAGERWRLEVFRTHGKIYEASASQMFKIPIEKITKGSDLRQKGKVSELALGYGGGPNALINMGALKMGLTEEELPALVKMWRNANKAITKFWYDCEDAAMKAIDDTPTVLQYGLQFYKEKNILFIRLPSGRKLSYLRPRVAEGRYGNTAIVYEGVDQTKKTWGKQETYGGKLVENIVQAVARDCLATALLRVDAAGYKICMHVHDEVVIEAPEGVGSCEEVDKIMSEPIPWAKGLPLTADSYETKYYRKD